VKATNSAKATPAEVIEEMANLGESKNLTAHGASSDS
jgi:hypothetical protein